MALRRCNLVILESSPAVRRENTNGNSTMSASYFYQFTKIVQTRVAQYDTPLFPALSTVHESSV